MIHKIFWDILDGLRTSALKNKHVTLAVFEGLSGSKDGCNACF